MEYRQACACCLAVLGSQLKVFLLLAACLIAPTNAPTHRAPEPANRVQAGSCFAGLRCPESSFQQQRVPSKPLQWAVPSQLPVRTLPNIDTHTPAALHSCSRCCLDWPCPQAGGPAQSAPTPCLRRRGGRRPRCCRRCCRGAAAASPPHSAATSPAFAACYRSRSLSGCRWHLAARGGAPQLARAAAAVLWARRWPALQGAEGAHRAGMLVERDMVKSLKGKTESIV